MRKWIDLIEAPIEDFTVHSVDGQTSFDKSDHYLINSEVGREKIIKAFGKTPFRFEIHFVENDRFDGSSDHHNGMVDEIALTHSGIFDQPMTFFGVEVGPKPQVITVVMLSNLSPLQGKMPLTGWTLAHKIGHSIQDNLLNSRWNSKLLPHVEKINKLISGLTSLKVTTNFDPSPAVITKLTMRSAREGELTNPFEVFAEIIAQYLITGRVTIKDDEAASKLLTDACTIVMKELNGKVLVEV